MWVASRASGYLLQGAARGRGHEEHHRLVDGTTLTTFAVHTKYTYYITLLKDHLFLYKLLNYQMNLTSMTSFNPS